MNNLFDEIKPYQWGIVIFLSLAIPLSPIYLIAIFGVSIESYIFAGFYISAIAFFALKLSEIFQDDFKYSSEFSLGCDLLVPLFFLGNLWEYEVICYILATVFAVILSVLSYARRVNKSTLINLEHKQDNTVKKN